MVNQEKRRLISQHKNTNLMPWVNNESVLTNNCTRCGDCISQCPEKIIKVGSGGFPFIDFNLGECTFCKACADVCSQPVFSSTLDEPWQIIACVKESCLANSGVYCRSCAEVCPEQALTFAVGISALPKINMNQCNGCGACVAPCPVNAISVEEIETNE